MTSTTATSATSGSSAAVGVLRALLNQSALVVFVAMLVVSLFLTDRFLTVDNITNILRQSVPLGIVSLGLLFVILTGGIDLSVGSTLGLCGVVAGALMQGVVIEAFGSAYYPSVWVVVLLTCALGAFVGAVNGVLIAYFKVPAFVATLGVLYVARGVALLMTNGLTYNDLDGKAELGNTGFNWLGFNTFFNVPIGVVVLAAVAIIATVLLNRTALGRWIYSTGGNARAAELSGVPVKYTTITVYVLSGVCAAIAGLVLSSQLTSAGPTAGVTYELTAIAAVVVGGAALTGGRGNVRGTLLGAFVIGFLSDGLVIIGVSAYWQTVFTGAVIVLAVLLNSIQYGHRPKRAATATAAPTLPQKEPAAKLN